MKIRTLVSKPHSVQCRGLRKEARIVQLICDPVVNAMLVNGDDLQPNGSASISGYTPGCPANFRVKIEIVAVRVMRQHVKQAKISNWPFADKGQLLVYLSCAPFVMRR